MMDYDTFAQRLGAAPGELDDAMREKARSCPKCAALLAELTQFDDVLRSAFDVDVPAGLGQLPEALEDAAPRDNVVPLTPKPPLTATSSPGPRMNGPLFAVAATVLLGIGMLFGAMLGKVSAELPQAVVAHVEHEPNLMQGDWSEVPGYQLNAVLKTARVSLNGDIGTVRHAGLCSFRGNKVAHVVVQSSNGPVTLMLLPDEKTDGITSFDEEGYRGILIPVGEGSVAIIGDDEASTDEVRRKVTDKVAWSI